MGQTHDSVGQSDLIITVFQYILGENVKLWFTTVFLYNTVIARSSLLTTFLLSR